MSQCLCDLISGLFKTPPTTTQFLDPSRLPELQGSGPGTGGTGGPYSCIYSIYQAALCGNVELACVTGLRKRSEHRETQLCPTLAGSHESSSWGTNALQSSLGMEVVRTEERTGHSMRGGERGRERRAPEQSGTIGHVKRAGKAGERFLLACNLCPSHTPEIRPCHGGCTCRGAVT